MTYLSLFEKIQILFGLFGKYYLTLLLIIILLISGIMRLLGKISNKKFLLIDFIAFAISTFLVVVTNYKILSKTFDNFWDIIFTNIYFPSIYVYLFVIISSYVVIILSIFNKRLSKVYKKINYISCLCLNILLLLILNIISTDKIDIFSNDSLYTNRNLVTMLELSINVYVLWLIITSAIYVINIVSSRIIENRENTKILSNVESFESDKEIDKLIQSEETINISSINSNKINDLQTMEVSNDLKNENSIEKSYNIDTILKTTESISTIDNIEIKKPKFIDYTAIDNIKSDSINDYKNNEVVEIKDKIETNNFDYESDILNKILSNSLNIDDSINEKSIVNGEFNGIKPNLAQILDNKIKSINLTTTNEIKHNKSENINETLYTLDNYKLFSKMLKETIKINNKTNIKIDEMLNLDLLNKFSYEEYSLFKKMLKYFTS